MQIIDLTSGDESAVQQAAALLVDLLPEGWATMDEALKEVADSFPDERISRVAVEDDELVGWIGGLERYGGHVWELHPLVVKRERQSRGIGRALVTDFEERVRERGGHTIYLGTDDKRGQTTLAGLELYPEPLAHAARLENPGRHPYGFYQKVGYTVVGVIPDANGFGKPDIFMAKRIDPSIANP